MTSYSFPHRAISIVSLICFIFLCPDISFAGLDKAALPVTEENNQGQEEQVLTETVTIDSQEHTVPDSWQGYKIAAPPLSSPPLVQVPPEFVKDNGQIFLLPEARDAFQEMAESAKEDGIAMVIDSGYRSAWYQKKIYKRLMAKGKSFAEVARYVAPPGYSEHMLGLAVDFVPSNWRFADDPAYQWLKEHGNTFGFNESYPEISSDKRPWEPSHWRYHTTISPQRSARKFK
jgi:LAS superfamily LD-carboxypeptidase LdcB